MNRIKLLLFLMLTLLGGCAVPLEQARSTSLGARHLAAGETVSTELDLRCKKLDNQRTTWGAMGKGAAALAGGSGVSTIPLDGHRDAQIAMAATSAGLAAFSLTALYVEGKKEEAWARECAARPFSREPEGESPEVEESQLE